MRYDHTYGPSKRKAESVSRIGDCEMRRAPTYSRHRFAWYVPAACALLSTGVRADVSDITNFVEYSPTFASAGQPTEPQFAEVKSAGFDRVIYIAFSNSGDALANEDEIVRGLGMDYVHVPVVWNEPTLTDFEIFSAVMQQSPEKKTLLHCQVNFRASAFSFLYRVIHEGVPIDEARAALASVWEPNETWQRFIADVLDAHGIAAD